MNTAVPASSTAAAPRRSRDATQALRQRVFKRLAAGEKLLDVCRELGLGKTWRTCFTHWVRQGGMEMPASAYYRLPVASEPIAAEPVAAPVKPTKPVKPAAAKPAKPKPVPPVVDEPAAEPAPEPDPLEVSVILDTRPKKSKKADKAKSAKKGKKQKKAKKQKKSEKAKKSKKSKKK